MTAVIGTVTVTATLEMTDNLAHIPKKIITFGTTLTMLGNSGDNLVASSVLSIQTENLNDLRLKQHAMKGGAEDRTQNRNAAFWKSYNDRKANMHLVQRAADDLHNPIAAEALIIRNGYGVKKHIGAKVINEISIKNKKNVSGTIIATTKSLNIRKKYSIDWQYSLDNGTTWISWHSTAVCQATITNQPSGSKIMVRRRFIIGFGTPEDWAVSNTITVM